VTSRTLVAPGASAPELVNVHDFAQDAVGKAVPTGIYDVQHNLGTVYVGQSADTPTFAVDNIAQWCADWSGWEPFPHSTEFADRGRMAAGSNALPFAGSGNQQLQEKVADRFP